MEIKAQSFDTIYDLNTFVKNNLVKSDVIGIQFIVDKYSNGSWWILTYWWTYA